MKTKIKQFYNTVINLVQAIPRVFILKVLKFSILQAALPHYLHFDGSDAVSSENVPGTEIFELSAAIANRGHILDSKCRIVSGNADKFLSNFHASAEVQLSKSLLDQVHVVFGLNMARMELLSAHCPQEISAIVSSVTSTNDQDV